MPGVRPNAPMVDPRLIVHYPEARACVARDFRQFGDLSTGEQLVCFTDYHSTVVFKHLVHEMVERNPTT
jgi:hypothetical protein